MELWATLQIRLLLTILYVDNLHLFTNYILILRNGGLRVCDVKQRRCRTINTASSVSGRMLRSSGHCRVRPSPLTPSRPLPPLTPIPRPTLTTTTSRTTVVGRRQSAARATSDRGGGDDDGRHSAATSWSSWSVSLPARSTCH